VTWLLRGDETDVPFVPADEFTGVSEGWLLSRLRLDPAASPVDVTDTSLMVYLDGDPVEDLQDNLAIFGDPTKHAEVVSFSEGDAGVIGGRFEVCGHWLHFWAYEIADVYTWIGQRVDLAQLAVECLSTDARYWEPQDGQTYMVESAYLDANDEQVRQTLLELAGAASAVILNEVKLN